MGRELKRVALNFAWPLNKVWKGFINPHWKPCPAEETNECHNGYTNAGMWLEAITRLIAMVGSEAADARYAEQFKKRGRTYPHPYLSEWSQAPRTQIPRAAMEKIRESPEFSDRMKATYAYLEEHPAQLLPLDEEMRDFVSKLSGEEFEGGMNDIGSTKPYSLKKRLLKLAGFKEKDNWGTCKACGGNAMDPTAKADFEAWEKEEPPEGEGWQLWETVSEGSPVSMVYATKEDFIEYLMKEGRSREGAERFCEMGSVPSMMMTGDGKIFSNTEICEVKNG